MCVLILLRGACSQVSPLSFKEKKTGELSAMAAASDWHFWREHHKDILDASHESGAAAVAGGGRELEQRNGDFWDFSNRPT